MKELVLTRYYLPDCTLGTLTGDEGLTLATIERPWLQNKPFVSCVPEGDYKVIRDTRPNRGPTFCLINHNLDVYRYPEYRKRDSILIHVGNWVKDIEGCIAPGRMFAILGGENAVAQSVVAWRMLNKYVGKDQEFKLIIRQYRPECWR